MTSQHLLPPEALNQDTVDATLRRDILAFSEKVFRTLEPTAPFYPNWHMEAISESLNQTRDGRINRLIINVPPRSLKSIMISIAYSAFMLGHNPEVKLICVSYAKDFAEKLGRDCRTVMQSDWYQRLFPRTIITKATADLIETSSGGARLATSIDGVVTGFGADTIIIDDPIKPNEAFSTQALANVLRYYRETLFSRLNSKVNGVIILVMQRLHEDDLAGHLLRDGGFHHLCFPATAVEDEKIELGGGRFYLRPAGEVLHAKREPESALNESRRNMGSAAFEAQYQQNPIPASGNMIKNEWLKTYPASLDQTGMKITHSWDTALKGNSSADYSVCTVWGELNGFHYLLDVFRKKLDFPELIKAVVALYQRSVPHAVLIEDHGSGISLIQQLRSQYDIHAIGRRSKDDKETRLSIVLPMFEAGQVVIPNEAPWRSDLLHELFGFPLARHDDQVDSISQYLGWARDSSSRLFKADFGMAEPEMSVGYVASALLAMPRYR
tara:strand:+ start:2447 stop:3937 length:1491 start_codon:yes stop_codon:yes gene_type:complete